MPTQTLKIVRIDSLLHQRAKILAAELDVPLQAFVEDAVRSRLAQSAVLKYPDRVSRPRKALQVTQEEFRAALEAKVAPKAPRRS